MLSWYDLQAHGVLPGCLKPLLDLLGYPATAISALSNGSLRIGYCISLCKKVSPLEFRFR